MALIHCPGRDADEILMCRQIDKLLGRSFISYWYDVLKRMLACRQAEHESIVQGLDESHVADLWWAPAMPTRSYLLKCFFIIPCVTISL